MRRSANIKISLFPFLAVLLCAMGALIVLLVILTHEVRQDAFQAAQAPAPPRQGPRPVASVSPDSPSPKTVVITRPAPPIEPAVDPNPALRAKLADLQQQRDQLENDLTKRKADLANLRSRNDSLNQKTQSARLSRDADRQRLAARSAELDEQRQQIQALEIRIAEIETDIDAAEQALASAAPKLQIVPYDGRSGTARKPILIECTGESIRFVPEDVRLTADDLEGFRPSFNPLLAGTAALRNYWAVNGESAESRPYVLLLVHEDGIIAYYAARSLLESLGTDTGYELITDDQELAYPELDPEAREVCRDAVRDALELRSAAEFSIARGEQTFRNGRFDVDPREHDPTRRDDDESGLYPVRPPSGSLNNIPRPTPPRRPGIVAEAAPRAEDRQTVRRSDEAGKSLTPERLADEPPRLRSRRQDIEKRDQPRPFPAESLEDLARADSRDDGSNPGIGSRAIKRQWGSSSPRAIISLERTVVIGVSEDLIQIGNQPALLVGPDGLNETIIEDVFRDIALEAAGWGTAPENFYWTPRIKAAVQPGGEFTFTRLRTALENAGLPVTDQLELGAGSRAPWSGPMPRRHSEDSAVAESDSFLDIVANIVGILIILIVIVGVRVGQSTVAPPVAVATGETSAPPREVPAAVLAPTPIFVDAPAPPAPPPIPVDPELLVAIDATASELRQLQLASEDMTDTATQLAAALTVARKQSDKIASEHAGIQQQLTEIDVSREDIAAQLKSLQDKEHDLDQQLSDVPAGNVTVLKHTLNPIGRSVRGQELHFRLAEGAISSIPLDDFIERLKPRIERQKEWVAKFNRHEGSIGPFEGYSMEYVIEREKLGLADELRLGSRAMRISVTGWKIVPQRTLVTESVAQALHPNSRFQQALRLADPDATLTFWVYPDSFGAYRKLQEFAHDKGFDVAARPLPAGVPIAGSPNGSRSSSQ